MLHTALKEGIKMLTWMVKMYSLNMKAIFNCYCLCLYSDMCNSTASDEVTLYPFTFNTVLCYSPDCYSHSMKYHWHTLSLIATQPEEIFLVSIIIKGVK